MNAGVTFRRHCAERSNAPELNTDTPSPLTSTLCLLHSVGTVPLNSPITVVMLNIMEYFTWKTSKMAGPI